MSSIRSKFDVDGQYVTHTGTDPWTGEPMIRRYWVPSQGGYVRLDTTRDGSRPGTLGSQPTYSDGSTWYARNVKGMLRTIKSQWQQEKRQAAKV